MKLILIFVLLLLASCSKKSKKLEIQFSRFGIMVEGHLGGQIDLLSNNKTINFKKESFGDNTFLQFDWEKNTQFTLRVNDQAYDFLSPSVPTPVKIAEIDLGNVNKQIKLGSSIDTDLAISPSNKYVAVGSYTGKLILYDIINNEVLWEYSIDEGVVKKVIFSDDSKYVFLGEQSMDGSVICFDVKSGKELWKYNLSDDLEKSAAPRANDPYGIYTLPGVFHFEFSEGKLLVAGLHSWYKDGKPRKKSKLYQFKASGEKVWEFPKKQPFHGNIQHFNSSKKLVVFSVGSILGDDLSGLKSESIVLVDKDNGKLLDQNKISPLLPHFPRVAFWQSVSIDRSEKFANMGVYDGRGFIFKINNNKFSDIIALELGKPVLVNNIPITAGIPYTNSANGHAIYSVVQTSIPYSYSSENNISEPPALHPAAGTLFFYDSFGSLVWKYKNGLIYSAVHSSDNGTWHIAMLDNKKENRENRQFGFTIFNYSNEQYKESYHYYTEGPAFFRGTISKDGKFAGVTETPYVLDDGETIKGSYKVHIVL